jgi:hypothetical protein
MRRPAAAAVCAAAEGWSTSNHESSNVTIDHIKTVSSPSIR